MKHVRFSNIVLVGVYVCVCLLSSCRPDTTCRENIKTGMICEYRYPYFDKDRQIQISVTWDSISVIGLNQVEPLYDNTRNVKQLSLPMHIAADSTEYALLYHQVFDTICVRHTNNPEFISLECGCAVRHNILSIRHTHHWIDSIAIVKDSIVRAGTTNIELWNRKNIKQ